MHGIVEEEEMEDEGSDEEVDVDLADRWICWILILNILWKIN